MGPTTAGKTQLAFALCPKLKCEIISVDSAMVYKHMNIGTAKPTSQELVSIPHHLINIRDPKEIYSAANFRRDAIVAIKSIQTKNKTPLLVGGTMLYFKALQFGIAKIPSQNAAIRARLNSEAARFGWPALHARLKQIDPMSAAKIHPNDSQRIQRALEVYALTKQPLSTLQQNTAETHTPYKFLNIAIAPRDRKILHDRITKRFDQMLKLGLIDEVKILHERGDLNPNLPAMRTVGYRQILAYLDGKLTFDMMREKAITATRRLAKRQLTWLRSWPELHWFDSCAPDLVVQVMRLIEGICG